MKACRKLLVLLSVISMFAFLVGCGTGTAEEVTDCDECRSAEYCVGVENTLYCSDPCLRHIDCAIGHWCVPEMDEVSKDDIVWVCMPTEHYTGLSRVWYWGETECTTGSGDECPAGMTCLVDVAEDPDIYFCSDSCTTNANCLSDCCYQWSKTQSYCVPEYPYCRTDIGKVYYWGETECTTGSGDECPADMTCLVDESQDPDLFFCSDECLEDSECVTGCCDESGYCAPEDPYCL